MDDKIIFFKLRKINFHNSDKHFIDLMYTKRLNMLSKGHNIIVS